ncbi:ATPase [Nocardiopsis sp. CNR-923]|uniref:ATPase n=1 Tax=Nocardiopsis sp. CNR-923 TaxID=1904965 RepID=UPI0009612693|nr:ATPase [Nocardiopsis sp. CNR-923]OLT28588.1 ATPase [Nocardiopsis sp. CNR-923]
MSVSQTTTVSGDRAVAGDTLVRRVGRATLRPFRSVDEVAWAVEVGRRLQRSTATGRRIVVDDLGTGADTAVVTALLARAFAHYRHDRVLAVDATGRSPSLAVRLGADGTAHLDSGVDEAAFETAREVLSQAGEGLWTVATARDDAAAYASRLLPLSRFFGVTLVAGAGDAAFVDAAAEAAHARVWVVRATRAAVTRVGRALDAFVQGGREFEARRTVVVLFDERRGEDPGLDAARTARVVADSGAGVVRMAHDRHLARGRGVRARDIAAATHRTILDVAAEALNRAVDGDRPGARRGQTL